MLFHYSSVEHGTREHGTEPQLFEAGIEREPNSRQLGRWKQLHFFPFQCLVKAEKQLGTLVFGVQNGNRSFFEIEEDCILAIKRSSSYFYTRGITLHLKTQLKVAKSRNVIEF